MMRFEPVQGGPGVAKEARLAWQNCAAAPWNAMGLVVLCCTLATEFLQLLVGLLVEVRRQGVDLARLRKASVRGQGWQRNPRQSPGRQGRRLLHLFAWRVATHFAHRPFLT